MHVIGTVNQEDSYIMETLNTLNFISKAKKIDINPKMNFQTKNESASKKTIAELLEKVKRLEAQKQSLAEENARLRQSGGDGGAELLEKARREKLALQRTVRGLRQKLGKAESGRRRNGLT